MKNIFLILIIFTIAISCKSSLEKNRIDSYKSYSLDANNSNSQIYFGKDTIFSEDYKGKSVLVIVDNKRKFAENVSSILDTLNAKYKYYLITQKDSIKRYSNLKTIESILIIN